MKLPLALGVAFAALAFAAAAQPGMRQMFVHHGGGDLDIDANNDGWITRAEAAAGFDRVFARLDSNNDGRLDAADRAAHHQEMGVRMHGAGGHGAGGHPGAHVMGGDDCTTTIDPPDAEPGQERRVTVICESEEMLEGEAPAAPGAGEHHIERHVIIEGSPGAEHGARMAPHAPHAPMPPHPPMFMMLIANSEEADVNGDGALSQDEFRTQHLRFFDASDANGDGRVRFEPPAPPQPPAPPAAPEPPAPPR